MSTEAESLGRIFQFYFEHRQRTRQCLSQLHVDYKFVSSHKPRLSAVVIRYPLMCSVFTISSPYSWVRPLTPHAPASSEHMLRASPAHSRRLMTSDCDMNVNRHGTRVTSTLTQLLAAPEQRPLLIVALTVGGRSLGSRGTQETNIRR